jgi:hypothetical protein
MSGGGCPSQIFANEPAGFSRLLAIIARDAMRSPSRPEYTIFPNRITDTLTMYQASVYIRGGSALSFRNYRFMGRVMPSERHAVQMAAREAIARLRDILPVMHTRPYHYLPCHVPYTSHYTFSCTAGERDEAIEPLVQYTMALESVFTTLVDDHLAARMDLARSRVPRRSEYRSPSPRAPCLPTPPYDPPTPTVPRRSSPSIESSRLVAPVPVRASPPTSTVPPRAGEASTTARLETIPEEEEEVESSAPRLGLTLGRAYDVPDTP